MPSQNRPKVAVAGAGGSIGSAVSHDLAKDHDVVALVGSRERLPSASETGLSLSWRFCELFSRKEVQKAIAGCDYIIYLFHTRIPTARLDQAECENMDLLRRAASVLKKKHIAGLRAKGNVRSISSWALRTITNFWSFRKRSSRDRCTLDSRMAPPLIISGLRMNQMSPWKVIFSKIFLAGVYSTASRSKNSIRTFGRP
jgi:hypothetical protein